VVKPERAMAPETKTSWLWMHSFPPKQNKFKNQPATVKS